jgi:molybdopterin/thiamine biosynthesis adenylyltransferase
MCLLPAVDVVNGWEGPVDIGFWLKKAEEWLRRYHEEKWGIPAELWAFMQPSLPGYRYRRALHDTQIVVLPPSWSTTPPGFGGVVVRIPRSPGVGAVVRWEAPPEGWRDWPAGAALVQGDADEIEGLWARFDQFPLTPMQWGFRDAEIDRHFQPNFLNRCGYPAALGQERVLITSLPDINDAPARSVWLVKRMGVGGKSFFQEFLENMERFASGEAPEPAIGIPLDTETVDARRRAGRSADMHERIATTQVVIAGLGSLGSEIAHLLAQEGVRNFYLVDGDILLPGNEARHRAGMTHAGRSKGDVVKSLILAIQPSAQVTTHHGWIDELLPTLTEQSDGGPTIFVGATGDEASEHLLSDAARDLEVPVVHAWLEMDGTVLRACRYVPGRDPTLSAASALPETPRLLGPSDPSAPRVCAETVLPGSALNIHAAANFAVRVILDVIAGGGDSTNHWLFAPGGVESPDAPAELRRPYGVLSCALRAS